MDVTSRPLAAEGFTSYRYAGRYGWIMIGAKDDRDARAQARRSPDGAELQRDRLQVWDGNDYRPVVDGESK